MPYEKLGRGTRYTKEFFIKQMFVLYGDNIQTVDSNFRGLSKDISVTCLKHSIKITGTPYKFFNYFCCPLCHKESVLKLKTDKFIKKATSIHENRYDYTKVKYVSSSKKIEIVCQKHGSFYQTPDNHLNGCGCPGCAREITLSARRLTRELFVERSKIIHNDKYDYSLVTYHNNSTPVKIICPVHGVFEQKPICHMSLKHGCQKCAQQTSSPSEVKIGQWLADNKIKFKTQVWFDSCRGKKRPLPFDFGVYIDNNLSLLIEFDGVHHYAPQPHFGGEESFKERQRLDEIKNNFCKRNKIPLLRIPYWKVDSFDKIIQRRLGSL